MSHIWMSHVTHVNKSCHVWTSHFAYEWVMPYKWMSHVLCTSHVTHMSESCYTYDYACHIHMSHVTHMNGSCRRCMTRIKPVNESCHTFWGATQLWRSFEWEGFQINCSSSDLKGALSGVVSMSHVTPNSKSCPINESCQIWMCHITYIFESCHINESCHIWISHVTHMNKKSHQRVIHMWMSHVKHINASCHISESHHIWMSHVTSQQHEWFMTHVNESHHIWMRHVTYEWVVSHQCVMFTCEWVESHMSIVHVTSTSHATYERVILHISISHVTCVYHWHVTNGSLFFLLPLLWNAIIFALFLRTPSLPWMPVSDLRLLLYHESRSSSPTVDTPSPTPFCWHPSLGDLGLALSRDGRVEQKDRHWVRGMHTQADSKTIRSLGWCQQNQGECRCLTVSTQNIVFFMFLRNLNYLYKIRN